MYIYYYIIINIIIIIYIRVCVCTSEILVMERYTSILLTLSHGGFAMAETVAVGFGLRRGQFPMKKKCKYGKMMINID